MMVKCPVCKEQAFRNKSGELLIHTTRGHYGQPPEICPGSKKGARP